MENTLLDSFAEFVNDCKIDRPTFIKILEESFRTVIVNKYKTDENFDVIVDMSTGTLQIWHKQIIVDDANYDPNNHSVISLTDARKIEKDFDIGEEVAQEILLSDFTKNEIILLQNTLRSHIKKIKQNSFYKKYEQNVGNVISVSVLYTNHKYIIVQDNDHYELILPVNECIPKEIPSKNVKQSKKEKRLCRGDVIKVVVTSVKHENDRTFVYVSRISPLLLEKLLEEEVPEIVEGSVFIKKIARIPGECAKVIVDSIADRIDPLGACIGMYGFRINNISGQLCNENISIIVYTENTKLFISRILGISDIKKISVVKNRLFIYVDHNDINIAIGTNGYNVQLAENILDKTIHIFSYSEEKSDDIYIEEFVDDIEDWIITELRIAGYKTANDILSSSKEKIEKDTDLEVETIDMIFDVINKKLNTNNE